MDESVTLGPLWKRYIRAAIELVQVQIFCQSDGIPERIFRRLCYF